MKANWQLRRLTRSGRHVVDCVAEEEFRVASDLDENVVRKAGLNAGLVDIKVCAITEVWSGLKFVIPVKDRPKRVELPHPVLSPFPFLDDLRNLPRPTGFTYQNAFRSGLPERAGQWMRNEGRTMKRMLAGV